MITGGEFMKVRHFAEIHYSGAFFTESEKVEIESNNIKSVKIPDYAVGVILFDVLESEVEHEGKKYILKSSERLNAQKYYVGRFLTIDDVAREYGENSTLYSNIVANHFDGAVVSKSGFCQGIKESDKKFVIDPKSLETDDVENE